MERRKKAHPSWPKSPAFPEEPGQSAEGELRALTRSPRIDLSSPGCFAHPGLALSCTRYDNEREGGGAGGREKGSSDEAEAPSPMEVMGMAQWHGGGHQPCQAWEGASGEGFGI